MDLTTLDDMRAKLNLASLGKPVMLGLAALLVMVAVTAGRMLFDTATASTIELDVVEQPSSASAQASEIGSVQQANTSVLVHVSGEVKKPGLVELEPGSRIADAVDAAGGFTDEADEESVNLAQKAEDGTHIRIAKRSESPREQDSTYAVSGDEGAVSQSLVNINTANCDELETLPGIGPSTAQKIVDDRDRSGPFATVEELTRVSGIGEKKLASLIGLICV